MWMPYHYLVKVATVALTVTLSASVMTMAFMYSIYYLMYKQGIRVQSDQTNL